MQRLTKFLLLLLLIPQITSAKVLSDYLPTHQQRINYANQEGIKNYKGTRNQNLILLGLLNSPLLGGDFSTSKSFIFTSNTYTGNNTFPSTTFNGLITTNQLGINTTTFDLTNPPQLKVDLGLGTSEDVVYANGKVNDFIEYNIRNDSTGTMAQSGYAATENNGTNTTSFIWLGLNNSGFNSTSTFNVGFASDTSVLSDAGDLYIANGISNRNIYFLTGGTSSTNRRAVITGTGNIGVGTSTPMGLFAVQSTGLTTGLTFLLSNLNSTTFKVFDNGHQATSSTPPVLSGASPATPSILGNDNRGTITMNGVTSTLIMTFAATWTSAPSCVISMVTSTNINILKYTISNSAVTFSTTTSSGIEGYKGSVVYYNCGGINE